MNYQTHTLSNGLRIIHLQSESPVSYCGFAVNAGTRDEKAEEFGMAHFVEHMLFKGTSHRRSWHILNRMENVGGELNAFTTKEETMVYALFLEEHFNRAFDLLSDLVLFSQFPDSEIEKEIEVVLDEINSYKDNPSELIYDDFENDLFSGHALGHYILGDPNMLPRFKSGQLKQFLKEQYTPQNMIFFSMGRTPFPKIVRMVEKVFADVPSVPLHKKRVAPPVCVPLRKIRKMDTFQGHAILGNTAYNMFDNKRAALALLNNLLGGPGMNSRLNLSLREKYGYVYSVESGFTSYTDTGVFSIYFGSDPKNVDRCLHLINKELKQLRERALTDVQLRGAKRQLGGQIAVGLDNRENTVLAMAKAFLHYGKYDSVQETLQHINLVSSSDLLAVANEILDENKLSRLIFT